jgi:hypothetical protein
MKAVGADHQAGALSDAGTAARVTANTGDGLQNVPAGPLVT